MVGAFIFEKEKGGNELKNVSAALIENTTIHRRPAGLSPEEFGIEIGVGKGLVYRLIKDGSLKAVKIGKRRLIIPSSEVNRILENGLPQ